MEINIDDYLDNEEIKEIAKNAVREMVAARVKDIFKSEQSIERIFDNYAAGHIISEVNKLIDGDMVKIIAKQIPGKIEDMSSHYIFKSPDAWEREPSEGWRIVQDEVRKQEARIREIVNERIDSFSKRIDGEFLKDEFYGFIETAFENLFKKTEVEE